jgi:hypothetical protein
MPEPRAAALTVSKGGIDRLRTKGGARADSLYDLTNAKIDAEYNIIPREGSLRVAMLPEGTVGLTAFDGKFHVYASSEVDLTGFDLFELDILLHPFDPTASVVEIHFAQPYLGALYVVAEFTDGQVYHYWLQPGQEWTASTEYSVNEFVTPTDPNGFVYSASRLGLAYPSWAAGVERTAGNGSSITPSIIEPTVYNEFFYEVIETTGDNPRSGSVEPTWPTATGATVVENTDGFQAQAANDVTPPTPPPANTPQASTVARYNR